MQGRSLVPLLQGRDAGRLAEELLLPLLRVPRRRTACGRTTASSPTATSWSASTSQADGTADVDYWELYDREKDPNEMKSFYADPAYAETVKELTAELDRLRKDLKVPDPTPKEAFGSLFMPPKKKK